MLYDKDRLDAAYATVGFIADSAWQTNKNDPFIRANQELWKRESALQNCSVNSGGPRSIMDTIPNSRLAEYGTYWYDEARECAYEPISNYSTTIAQPDIEKTLTTYVSQEFRNEDLFQSQEVEKLFNMLSDTTSNTHDIENRCQNFLKDFEIKEVRLDMFTLIRKSDSTAQSVSEGSESDPDLSYDSLKMQCNNDKIFHSNVECYMKSITNNCEELVLQTKLQSEEIKSIWDSKAEDFIISIPQFCPKFYRDDDDDPIPSVNYEMVPNVQPWLNYGYPLRHSDFNELAFLSSDMDTLRLSSHQTALRPVQHLPPLPQPRSQCSVPVPVRKESIPIPLVPKEAPPARRLYSAVLQNQMGPTMPVPNVGNVASGAQAPGTVATVAATTVSTDELDELEREAIEQYRPSNESLAKGIEDSIISAKFQELERLALEQYNSASTLEARGGESAGGSTVAEGAGSAGNASSPLHEPPCGGKPNPYAALLVANWNSVIMGLYRSRLLACLGAGARFR